MKKSYSGSSKESGDGKRNNDNSDKAKEKRKKEKLEDDSLTYYTDYGYVQVKKDDKNKEGNMIKFEKKNNKIEGRISKQNLSEKITIHLKTLYGQRKTYTFEISINSKLERLIDMLVDQEAHTSEKVKWNYTNQYRLISSNGLIKELNPLNTFADEEIKDNSLLILASPYGVYFSDTMKHQGIYVSFYL